MYYCEINVEVNKYERPGQLISMAGKDGFDLCCPNHMRHKETKEKKVLEGIKKKRTEK
jgi:hypothetical protein